LTNQVYQMSYDENLDSDIHTWLESLPRSRKAELVRNAIRFYIQSTNSSISPVSPKMNSNKNNEETPPIYEIAELEHKQLEISNWFKKMPKNVDIDLVKSLLKYHNTEFGPKSRLAMFKDFKFEGIAYMKDNGFYQVVYINGNEEEGNRFILDHVFSIYVTQNLGNFNEVIDEFKRLGYDPINYTADKRSVRSKLIINRIKYDLNVELAYFFDFGCLADEYNAIKNTSGIYTLYDDEFNLVYVGKAKSLKDRVRSHVHGLTHTKDYYESFTYIAVMYVNDYENEADLIEKDFIRNYSPKMNKMLTLPNF
jgi:GIY-YIG catalytic domain